MITLKAFAKWLESAPPGARVAYHIGHLARDRVLVVEDPTQPSYFRYEPIEPLNGLADEIYQDAMRGLVFLTQRKAIDTYVYYVTRSGKETYE